MLAFVAPRLPDEVQHALASMRDAAQPVAFAVVRKTIEDGLGRNLDELFASIDPTPLSAASIGQLHRATLPDGRAVVVKAQYPGIRAAIEADMDLIRWLAPLAKRVFPGANVDDVMETSRLHMLAECDYLREAELQAHARALAARHPDVLVPEVIATHTCETVLTMEYVDGATFDVFTARATQDERDHAGRAIYAFVWDSLLNDGFFNGDPHPGNFLFLKDGRVALLDYGYAEVFPEARRVRWRVMIQALLEGDKATFTTRLPEMGYFANPALVDAEAVWRAARGLATAIVTDLPMRFSRAAIARNVERATIDHENRSQLRLPAEDVRAMRFTWCLQGTLGALGAEAVWSAIMRLLLRTDRAA